MFLWGVKCFYEELNVNEGKSKGREERWESE